MKPSTLPLPAQSRFIGMLRSGVAVVAEQLAMFRHNKSRNSERRDW